MTDVSNRGGTGSFTVRGMRNGSLVHITWSDGFLSGDPPTVDLLEVEAEVVKGRLRDSLSAPLYAGAPEGFVDDPLGDPACAYFLIERVFDIVREVTGDAPPNAAAGRRRRG